MQHPPNGYGAQPYPTSPVWVCPFCHRPGQLVFVSKVSTAGWITFILLLLFCFPLCFLGLLMKDSRSLCPNCHVQIN